MSDEPELRPERSDRIRKTLPALAVAALLIAFGVANSDKVKVNWLLFSTHNSLIVVIAVAALLGAVVGALAARRRGR